MNGGQPFPSSSKPKPAIHIKRITQGVVRS